MCMKSLSLIKFSVLVLLSLNSFFIYSQTTTTASGNWTTPGNWSAGVPGSGTNTTVNHSMTLNSTLTVNGATYTFNASVSDPIGGTNYNITLSNTSMVDV